MRYFNDTRGMRTADDERYGRAWAAMMGIRPTRFPPFGSDPRAFWKCPYIPGVGHVGDAYSEADAYAAIGQRVREIQAIRNRLLKPAL